MTFLLLLLLLLRCYRLHHRRRRRVSATAVKGREENVFSPRNLLASEWVSSINRRRRPGWSKTEIEMLMREVCRGQERASERRASTWPK